MAVAAARACGKLIRSGGMPAASTPAPAAPIPPPRRRSSSGSVRTSLAPLMPTGWPAEGDGAAVDVHPVRGQAESRVAGEGDPGEGLVDLDQVQLAEAQGAVAAQGVADRTLAGWCSN